MQNTKKLVIGVVLLLVIGIVVLVGQGAIFQGKIFKSSDLDEDNVYLYKNEVVSGVASSVVSAAPSVVVSDVSSPGGTSRVASVVVSALASPVASPVVLNEEDAAKVNPKELKELTEEKLESIEKEYYKNNKYELEQKAKEEFKNTPDKFELGNEEKEKLVELYKAKNPSEFKFEPSK